MIDTVLGTPKETRTTCASARFALLGIVLRALVVLLAGELSGVGHMAADLCVSLDGSEHHLADCSDEEGHECPPGCPDCHSWRGAAGPTTARHPISKPAPVALISKPRSTTPYAARAPSETDPDSVYRPPRPFAFV